MNKVDDGFEPVLMVWDIYDGPWTGLAYFNGSPHFFENEFDESIDDFRWLYALSPVNADFVKAAKQNWVIFREWEKKFHHGESTLDAHPGHGGINDLYDKLESELEAARKTLVPIAGRYVPTFRELPGQDDMPAGILRELEVKWSLE